MAGIAARSGQLADASAVRPEGVRLRLLGGFALLVRGLPVVIPRSQRRLLALVALRRASSRNGIAGTLWPEVPDARALGSLRTTLWRLTGRLDAPGRIPQPVLQV